jgi:hypothetical protein
MALHRYVVDVEYNEHLGYHPITVTVKNTHEKDTEFSGKSLKSLLSKAVKQIREFEADDPINEI